jgi:hypothetical protein
MASPSARAHRRASRQASSRAKSRVGSLASWVRRWYGANPLHLLALLASFALAGYAVRAVIMAGQWTGFAAWFAVAIIGHDLLLFPLYSLADLSLRHLLPGGSHGRLPAAQSAARGPFEAFQPVGSGPSSPGAPPSAPPSAPPGGTSVTLRPAPAQLAPAQLAPAQLAPAQLAPAQQAPAQLAPAQPAAAQPGGVAPAWPPLLNYVRIPVIFSLLLLMTFFPMILGLSEPELHRASGLTTEPYLWRWLGVTGVMFAISAVSYAVRTRRTARRTARRTR